MAKPKLNIPNLPKSLWDMSEEELQAWKSYLASSPWDSFAQKLWSDIFTVQTHNRKDAQWIIFDNHNPNNPLSFGSSKEEALENLNSMDPEWDFIFRSALKTEEEEEKNYLGELHVVEEKWNLYTTEAEFICLSREEWEKDRNSFVPHYHPNI
tara:strand:- start:4958 stop:5416 length:459 start_codon:yes stop_codon:yes gene_type:complete